MSTTELGALPDDPDALAARWAADHPEPPEEAQTEPPEPPDDDDRPKREPSAAVVLVRMAQDAYTLGRTPEGEPFGIPSGRHVVRMLRGGDSLGAELAARYFRVTGRVAPAQACADAMRVLDGMAAELDPTPVHLRCATEGGALWLDMGDAAERVLKVTGDGWQVTDNCPVLFRRSALTAALPDPERGGSMADLWGLLNVAERDRPVLSAWLSSAWLAVDWPTPALAITGEQGTGKSTACRFIVDLVDPATVPLRKPPRDVDSWVTAAQGSRVVGLDNLSRIRDDLSDTLCRAVTGDGDVRRKLYTDGGLATFSFRRALLLNGIDLGGLNADLAERLASVELATIGRRDRLAEEQLNAEWERVRPRVLGALLDGTAAIMAVIPSVELETPPRMADFARVLAAVDMRDGTAGVERYAAQAVELAENSAEEQPFIAAMRSQLLDEFDGPAADLLDRIRHDGDRPPKGWPSGARAVTGLLKRNAPSLRALGWAVTSDDSRGGKAHAKRWTITPPPGDDPAADDTPSRDDPESLPPCRLAAKPSVTRGDEGGKRGGKVAANSNLAADGGNAETLPPVAANFAASPNAPLIRGNTPESGKAAKRQEKHPISTWGASAEGRAAAGRIPAAHLLRPGSTVCAKCGDDLLTADGLTTTCQPWHAQAQGRAS